MKDIMQFLSEHDTLWEIAKLLVTAVLTGMLVTIVLKAEHKVYLKLMAKRNNINLRFVENIVRFVIIFIAVQAVIMGSKLTQDFGRTLFQGTTVIAAIAGFAAQP